MLNKQQLFRRARELLLGAVVRKKQQQQGNRKKLAYGNTSASTLLYKPNELLQLDLVKESNAWIRIFEFMMTFPEVFTTLTNPLKSQKYVRPVLSANTSAPAAPATTAAAQADIKKVISCLTSDVLVIANPLFLDAFFSVSFTANYQVA